MGLVAYALCLGRCMRREASSAEDGDGDDDDEGDQSEDEDEDEGYSG